MELDKEIEQGLQKIGYNQAIINVLDYLLINFDTLKKMPPIKLIAKINNDIVRLDKK